MIIEWAANDPTNSSNDRQSIKTTTTTTLTELSNEEEELTGNSRDQSQRP